MWEGGGDDATSQTLVKQNKLPDIFAGKEALGEVDWLFYLSGIVLPQLIKRIHNIGESGIWQW